MLLEIVEVGDVAVVSAGGDECITTPGGDGNVGQGVCLGFEVK